MSPGYRTVAAVPSGIVQPLLVFPFTPLLLCYSATYFL